MQRGRQIFLVFQNQYAAYHAPICLALRGRILILEALHTHPCRLGHMDQQIEPATNKH